MLDAAFLTSKKCCRFAGLHRKLHTDLVRYFESERCQSDKVIEGFLSRTGAISECQPHENNLYLASVSFKPKPNGKMQPIYVLKI